MAEVGLWDLQQLVTMHGQACAHLMQKLCLALLLGKLTGNLLASFCSLQDMSRVRPGEQRRQTADPCDFRGSTSLCALVPHAKQGQTVDLCKSSLLIMICMLIAHVHIIHICLTAFVDAVAAVDGSKES